MPYYRTEITAGKTVEVIKSYSKRIGDHRPRGGKEKPTAEEMEKVSKPEECRGKIKAAYKR